MKISDIGEFGLINQISLKFKDIIPNGCMGIGDDCAVIPISDLQSMVVTTDMLIEDTHFLLDMITPYELGYKSLAVNLSDIAAMGANPHSVFLSIALPSSISTEWCDSFIDGFREHNVPLLGGDTTRSADKIAINVTAIGVADNEKIKYRNGAKVGDKIYVTATLGDSAGGFLAIKNSCQEEYPFLTAQHNFPRPHMFESQTLSSIIGVHSMIDISDGLASDLRHILKSSNVGATVELSKIPLSEELKRSPWNALELALAGGEDYCLLFTASTGVSFPENISVYEIGEITNDNIGEIIWTKKGNYKGLNYRGFVHF